MFGHHQEKKHYENLAIPFCIISVAVAVAVFYVFFSWATITIIPSPSQSVSSITATVREASSESGDSTISLAGSVLQTELTGEGVFSVTTEERTRQRRTGVISIVNTSSHNQPLIATTRLLSRDNVLFRTQKSVVVPAKGSIEVPVIQDDSTPSDTFDSSRFTLPALWSGLQQNIYGTSYRETEGTERSIKTLGQSDIDGALSKMTEQMSEKFKNLLVDLPIVASMSKPIPLFMSEVTTHASDRAIGQEVDQFKLAVTIRFSGVVYDEQNLMQSVRAQLKEHLPPGHDLLPLGPQDLQVNLETIDLQKNEASLAVVAKTESVLKADSESFPKKDLIGLSPTEIKEYLSSFAGVKQVEVQLYPFWVTRAPYLVDHISITIKK